MAPRFPGTDGNRLSRTTCPTTNVSTWLAWVYLSANPGGGFWSTFMSYTGGNLPCIQLYNGTNTLTIGETINNTTNGSTLSLSTWYHIAWVRYSLTHNMAYLNGVVDIDDSSASIGSNAETGISIGQQGASGSTELNGRVAGVKIYDNVTLTQAEIQKEMYSYVPRRTANLWAWYPLLSGTAERLRDYSGNGRGLSLTGSLADEAEPPRTWGGVSLAIGRSALAPAEGVLDNFNRADSGTLGTNWSQCGGNAQLQIISNQVSTGNSVSTFRNYWNIGTFGPDCEAFITQKALNGGDSDGVYLRLDPATGNGYEIELTGTTIDVYKMTGWTSFAQVGTSVSRTTANGTKLLVRATGSNPTTFDMYTDEGAGFVWRGSVSDSTSPITAAGYSGIQLYQQTAGALPAVDDFGAGTIGGGAGPDLSINLNPITGRKQGVLIY